MINLIDYLGIISTAPPNPQVGDMIMRSQAGGWTTYNPGPANSVLTIDQVLGYPVWMSTIVAVLPTASVYYQGQILTVPGGSGAADVAYICLKGAGGSYSWKTLASG